MDFSFKTRPELIQKLKSDFFDILVIGGGITGAAVARNAALRGLKVALVESKDFASGTSSGSSKLIHGGIRYLENFEFKLVFEAIQEREKLHALYAPYVKPLDFVFPVYKGRFPNRFMLAAGLTLYDAFCGFRHTHKTLSAKDTLKKFPFLNTHHLSGCGIYTDSFAEDYRLVIELIKSANKHGAIPVSRLQVSSIEKNTSGFTCSLDDLQAHQNLSVKAKRIFNCSGPFSDGIRKMVGLPPTLKLTQGVHFIVDRSKVPVDQAFVMSDPKLHRILFVIPWGTKTYLGTTDTSIDHPNEARASANDLDYVLHLFHEFFSIKLDRKDILQSWAAVRPLLAPSKGSSNSAISRDFVIEENPKNFFHILGGKLTSHRVMAQEALNKVPEFKQSEDPTDKITLAADNGSIVDDLEFSVHHEMVLSSMDYIRRRSSLYYLQPDPQILCQIPSRLGKILGWSSEQIESDVSLVMKEFEWDQKGY